MKVLLVNGSPRKEGNTFTALSQVKAQLEKNGVEAQIIWIGNKFVRGCIACNTCKTTGSGRCVFDDDVCNEVIAAMEHSDAIIIGAPVYYGQPAAQAMCLQQRLLYAGGAFCVNKPAAAVCVCRRGGATASFQTLQMTFQMMNMPIVTSQYWNIAYGRLEGESAQDLEGMQIMRTLADNMAHMLRKLHSGDDAAPAREARITTNFIR